MGNLSRPGILELIMDWPEGKKFGTSPGEEVARAKEAPPYNELPEMKRNMPCSQMDHVVLWESIADGKPLCGAPHDKLQRPLKEKENRANLQR